MYNESIVQITAPIMAALCQLQPKPPQISAIIAPITIETIIKGITSGLKLIYSPLTTLAVNKDEYCHCSLLKSQVWDFMAWELPNNNRQDNNAEIVQGDAEMVQENTPYTGYCAQHR